MGETKGAGPEKNIVIRKTGNGFKWTGLKPDLDAADLPVNSPRQLQNMRLRGGRHEGRGGQILLGTHVFPITGMADYFTEVIETPEVVDVLNELIWASRQIELDSSSGAVFDWTRGDDPSFVEATGGVTGRVVNGGTGLNVDIPGFTGYIYGDASTSGVKAQVYGIDFDDVSPSLAVLFELTDTITIAGSPVNFTSIVQMCQQGDNIYILARTANWRGAGLFSWDGTTLTLEHTEQASAAAVARSNGFVAVYGDTVVSHTGIPPAVGNAQLLTRDPGGTWAGITYTMGSAQIDDSQRRTGAIEYDGNLYFQWFKLNEGSKIGIFDGAAITFHELFSTDPLVNYTTISFAVLNGNLYYGWTDHEDPAATAHYVGVYDGATWDDTHKALTTQLETDEGRVVSNQDCHILTDGSRLYVPFITLFTSGLMLGYSGSDGIDGDWAFDAVWDLADPVPPLWPLKVPEIIDLRP